MKPAHNVNHVTPSFLAASLGISPKAVNDLLVSRGYQARAYDHKSRPYYVPTEKGQAYAVLIDVKKRHADGTAIQQLRWMETIINVL